MWSIPVVGVAIMVRHFPASITCLSTRRPSPTIRMETAGTLTTNFSCVSVAYSVSPIDSRIDLALCANVSPMVLRILCGTSSCEEEFSERQIDRLVYVSRSFPRYDIGPRHVAEQLPLHDKLCLREIDGGVSFIHM